MVSRKIGHSTRLSRKKRLQVGSKKQRSAAHHDNEEASGIKKRPMAAMRPMRPKQNTAAQLKKKRSELLKRQAAERMVLKERLRDLMDRRSRLRKGEKSKVERRELNKYIRELKEQLTKRHASALADVNSEISSLYASGNRKPSSALHADEEEDDWEDEPEEPEGAADILQMFSHLTA